MGTFVRVVEAGNLSAAAKQLRISVAAVSRQIAGLEREVGMPLLARTTRRISVTNAGNDYYERCLRILRDVDDAQAVGRRGGLHGGVLRISVPVTAGVIGGARLFQSLIAEHPSLRLDIRMEDRVIDLVLEDVDVAIRVSAKPPLSTEIVAHPLSTWRRIIVASPSYIRSRGEPKTPAALATHDALSPVRYPASERWTLEDGAHVESVRLRTRYSCNEGHLLRDLAVEGCGIALLPDWFVADDLRRKRLRRLLPSWQSEPVIIHALYRAAHRSEPRVRALVDHLRAAYADVERGSVSSRAR